MLQVADDQTIVCFGAEGAALATLVTGTPLNSIFASGLDLNFICCSCVFNINMLKLILLTLLSLMSCLSFLNQTDGRMFLFGVDVQGHNALILKN